MKNFALSLLVVPALMGCHREVTHEREFVGPNNHDLAKYYLYLAEGDDPKEDRQDRLQARAMEMIELNGLLMRAESEITIAAEGGVPTKVKLDGFEVPIEDLYTQDELARLKAVRSLKAMLAV